jgi:hypothetical protein
MTLYAVICVSCGLPTGNVASLETIKTMSMNEQTCSSCLLVNDPREALVTEGHQPTHCPNCGYDTFRVRFECARRFRAEEATLGHNPGNPPTLFIGESTGYLSRIESVFCNDCGEELPHGHWGNIEAEPAQIANG